MAAPVIAVGAEDVPVCVFAKPPVAGAVKTRLAATVGGRRAADLARAFLLDTRASLEATPWATPVFATTAPLGELAGGHPEWEQGTGDLGARLERVLRRALQSAGMALAVGADSPGLPREHLDLALAHLRHADAVIGPADDGGFYLLGLRRCPPGLLANLPWSSPDTCAAVEQRLHSAGLRTVRVASWFDVDDARSLERLRGLLHGRAAAAPRTAHVLERAISVVIPTLDEAARIERQVTRVAGLSGIREVIVVDGGSRDDTPARARRAGAAVMTAARGRGTQLAAGAARAVGEVIMFLHADVELPDDACRHVARALADPAVGAGAFRTWTVPDGSSRLGPLLHLADLRSRYTSLPYGDQALFVRAAVFDAVGGYPPWPLFEDLELAKRLRRKARLVTVPASVRVSGRRFQERPLYWTAVVNLLPALYRLGVPPAALARFYGPVR